MQFGEMCRFAKSEAELCEKEASFVWTSHPAAMGEQASPALVLWSPEEAKGVGKETWKREGESGGRRE